MIKNIFLPEQIKNYYLFSKKIAGISLGKMKLHATIINAYRATRSIEKCLEISLDTIAAEDSTARTVEGLKQLVSQLGSVHEIRTALPSSLVIFKELRVPFSSYEKIALVIPFEVEPLLPFSLADAVIDFIITYVDPETKHAHILVAAVQKTHIVTHLELLAQAGINPQRISIDMFDLYSLYKAIPAYGTKATTSTLISIGLQDTTIAYIDSGRLRFIRTVPKGILGWAKYVGDSLHITPAQAMEHIMRFGTQASDWPEYTKAITECVHGFLETVQFTLNSFATQAQTKNSLESILILSSSELPKGLVATSHEFFKVPTTALSAEHITTIANVTLKQGITQADINFASCAIALPTSVSEQCNLRTQEFEMVNRNLMYAQLGVALALSLATLAALTAYSYTQLSMLSKEVTESESETLSQLSERFKNLENEGGALDDLIEGAQKSLDSDKKTWSAFSGESRISYLRYLLELTNTLDKEALGLTLDKITFTENYLILKGRVKDYDALKLLKQELRQSKLFKQIEPENNNPFEALKITLAHGTEKE